MAQGTIENSTGAQINLRKLGWLIPAFGTVDIPDEFDYQQMKLVESELAAKIAAGTVVLRDAGAQIIAAGELGNWVGTKWLQTDLAPSADSYRTSFVFDGRVKADYIHFFGGGQKAGMEGSFQIMQPCHLKRLFLAVSRVDIDQTYGVSIYTDTHTSDPLVVHANILILPVGTRTAMAFDLNYALPIGEYGVVIVRVTGTKKNSKFDKTRVDLEFEVD